MYVFVYVEEMHRRAQFAETLAYAGQYTGQLPHIQLPSIYLAFYILFVFIRLIQ